jgi:hypothetical protein
VPTSQFTAQFGSLTSSGIKSIIAALAAQHALSVRVAAALSGDVNRHSTGKLKQDARSLNGELKTFVLAPAQAVH